jgi:exopolysaccharide production protein ExoZ
MVYYNWQFIFRLFGNMLKNKIASVQYLRGMAALGVVFCHYGSSLPSYPKLSLFFNYGQSGVFIFFLIRGFIIVYSLVKSNYKTEKFFKFLLKRSLRIDPSYIVVILLTLLLFDILPSISSFKGQRIVFIPGQFIAHLFYVIPFTKYSFYNHVFWTLSVEFQFYLLIGLLYFVSDNLIYKSMFLILFSLTSFIPFPNNNILVFHYAPIFALGISLLSFYFKKKLYNAVLPLLLLILIGYKFGASIFFLLMTTCLIILTFKVVLRPLEILGDISYSLYLTHPLVFIVFLGVVKRFHVDIDNNQFLLLLVGVLTAVLFAYLFFVGIEKPSIRLSKRIFYNKSHQIKD